MVQNTPFSFFRSQVASLYHRRRYIASVFDFTFHEVLYCQSASFDRHSVSSRIIVRLQARPKPPPQ